MAAWRNIASTFIRLGDLTSENFKRDLLQASTDYNRRPIGELITICEEAVDSAHAAAMPHVMPLVLNLLLAIRKAQTKRD